MTRTLVTAAVLLIAISAVGIIVFRSNTPDRDRALASLSEPILSDHYTSSFWPTERATKSPLWNEALAVCGHPAVSPRPNCAVVIVVAGSSAQEELARQELAERRAVKAWLSNGATGEIGNGLTGRGAKEGGLPTFQPPKP